MIHPVHLFAARHAILKPLGLMAAVLLLVVGGGLPAGVKASPVAASGLTIVQWTNPPAIAAVKQLTAAFNKQYPGINATPNPIPNAQYGTVQQTRLTANLMDIWATFGLTGQPQPWSPGALEPIWKQWIDAGLVLDLTGQPFLKYYDPQALKNTSTYNGKIYEVSTGSYPYTGMFYNKSIFAKYGLQVPTTWSQFIAVLKTLKAHGVIPWTVGGKETFPLDQVAAAIIKSLYPNENPVTLDHDLWTGKVKYTDPKNVLVLSRTQEMMTYAQPGFMGLDTLGAAAQFAAGRVAMDANGTWDAPTIAKANPSLQFGYFPIPGSDRASDNVGFAGKYNLSWMVAAKSKNKAAALKWLTFFSQPANYATYVNEVGIIPSEPNIKLTSPFFSELQSATKNFSLAFDEVQTFPQHAGQYAGFVPQFLAPAGPIASATQLAQMEQADWDAAVKHSR